MSKEINLFGDDEADILLEEEETRKRERQEAASAALRGKAPRLAHEASPSASRGSSSAGGAAPVRRDIGGACFAAMESELSPRS